MGNIHGAEPRVDSANEMKGWFKVVRWTDVAWPDDVFGGLTADQFTNKLPTNIRSVRT